MNDAAMIDAVRAALREAMLLAAGPLAVALIAGALVALGQAMTQMNEPTTGLVARMVSVAFVLLVLLPWLVARWIAFATEAFGSAPLWFGPT